MKREEEKRKETDHRPLPIFLGPGKTQGRGRELFAMSVGVGDDIRFLLILASGNLKLDMI